MEEENQAPKHTAPRACTKSKLVIALLIASVLLNLGLIVTVVVAYTGDRQIKHVTQAVCRVKPNPSSKLDNSTRDENPIEGTVMLTQKMGDALSVSLDLRGFKAESSPKKHGFHVHQSGDIVTDGCQSAKGHFNPENKKHGNIDDVVRHVGDWGNIVVPASGSITKTFEDKVATLTGEHGVLGRAIVIHQLEDDLGRGGNEGSEKTGNAGKRLACCVIVPQ